MGMTGCGGEVTSLSCHPLTSLLPLVSSSEECPYPLCHPLMSGARSGDPAIIRLLCLWIPDQVGNDKKREVGNDKKKGGGVWGRGWEWGGRGPYPVPLFWGKYPTFLSFLRSYHIQPFSCPDGATLIFL